MKAEIVNQKNKYIPVKNIRKPKHNTKKPYTNICPEPNHLT
jgi:hypothetical protein